ncbi:pimeloyl-ACP methyl ester carboxylesterase [Actinomycetospora succinea]|uniref:Pimeloyl-ACP methyl ester carboxylesterase n=1 Tax=Actinomycetospora succinea TaxID=663603 RepID=A0A4R6VTV3_9PSEU|nr:alpha/beta hydrolase [Actinomycetospora succinea]TDQ66000.1 pimeloyl-ACP methyl ester carboxylesterase [Actinomycetospora succinea]
MTAPAATDTLAVPGARLHHEVRGAGPLVVLLGTPMDAHAFAGLADLLAADHTVLTTDVRGIGRSPVDDPDASPTLSTRADDVARLIRHVGAGGPVTLFGSSGGAVTALALAQEHPDLVDTVIAHEPPLVELLDDREARHAGGDVVIERWFAGDHVGSWRAFLENADIAMPEEVFQMVFAAAPDAAAKADGDYQNAHLLRPTTHFRPDVDALRAGGPRIVVGIGEDSAGQLCDRTSRALAAALGVAPTLFPGDHVGFAEDPAAFLPALRAVLPA